MRTTGSMCAGQAINRGDRYADPVLKVPGFKRSASRSPAASKTTTEQSTRETADGVSPGAKGRATPKRREAEAARRTSVIAGSGGARGGRQSRTELAQRRAALRRGDESVLSARDRGPVRSFVRDYVDSRRNVVGLFIYIGVPCVLVTFVRLGPLTLIGLSLLYGFIAVAIVDFILMLRGLGKAVAAKFPDQPRKGLNWYAVTRASQLRRSRIPAPKVERGTKVA